jgi:hypothetical protein
MPEFNIFIMTGDVPKKEKKKESKKENLLAKALKKSDEKDDEMISHLAAMKDKMRRLPMTSHVGGG